MRRVFFPSLHWGVLNSICHPPERGEGGGFALVQLPHLVLKIGVVNIYVLSLVLSYSQFQQITLMATVNEDLAIPFLLCPLGFC